MLYPVLPLRGLFPRPGRWKRCFGFRPGLADGFGLAAGILVIGCIFSASVLAETANEKNCLDAGPAELESSCTRAVDDRSRLKDVYLRLGAYLKEQGRFDEAVTVYEKGLGLVPKDPELLHQSDVANSLAAEDQWRERREGQSSQIKQDAVDAAKHKLNIIRCRTLSGEVAIEACRRVIKVDAEDAMARNRLVELGAVAPARDAGRPVATVSPSPAKPAPSRQQSEQREQLRKVQTHLATLGYTPGIADGIMGGQTRSAIKAFLSDTGQAADPSLPQLLELTSRAVTTQKQVLASLDALEKRIQAGELEAAGEGLNQLTGKLVSPRLLERSDALRVRLASAQQALQQQQQQQLLAKRRALELQREQELQWEREQEQERERSVQRELLKAVQTDLATLGYLDGAPNGQRDDRTEAAITSFVKAQGASGPVALQQLRSLSAQAVAGQALLFDSLEKVAVSLEKGKLDAARSQLASVAEQRRDPAGDRRFDAVRDRLRVAEQDQQVALDAQRRFVEDTEKQVRELIEREKFSEARALLAQAGSRDPGNASWVELQSSIDSAQSKALQRQQLALEAVLADAESAAGSSDFERARQLISSLQASIDGRADLSDLQSASQDLEKRVQVSEREQRETEQQQALEQATRELKEIKIAKLLEDALDCVRLEQLIQCQLLLEQLNEIAADRAQVRKFATVVALMEKREASRKVLEEAETKLATWEFQVRSSAQQALRKEWDTNGRN